MMGDIPTRMKLADDLRRGEVLLMDNVTTGKYDECTIAHVEVADHGFGRRVHVRDSRGAVVSFLPGDSATIRMQY